ncbi:MAG TPA: YihY/virulence factor BrkB family protein [Flavobacterium sp.]|nr:YihY/virulence factor BrkB family protein [Flavobacterium sp.]HLW62091.1 YihY/virulence factor BrkB family protein [Flavobacterium sp.]
MVKEKLKSVFKLFKVSVMEFLDDNCVKFSASLSYYTIFSIPPLAILIISSAGYFFGEEAVRGEFFSQIEDLVGSNAALQIQEAIKGIRLSDNMNIATIIGFVTLLFSASGIFAEIQSSINYIWELKPKPKKGLVRMVINRLISFSMIGALGFILLVSLIVNTTIEYLYDYLSELFHNDIVFFASTVNSLIVLIIVMLIFGFIFKTLPDGKLGWKETMVGSLFTAVLFMIGKWAIGLYLGNSAKMDLYGAAGSILVILVWVYYSAIILYFGAVFTKNYSEMYGKPIKPNDYTMRVILKEEEVKFAKTDDEIEKKLDT